MWNRSPLGRVNMSGRLLTVPRTITNMRHKLTALHGTLILAMIFGFAACGDGVLGPLNDQVFVLQTIGEDSLPAIVDDLGGPWTIIADTIWFHSGSDWRRRQVHRRGLSTGNDLVEWETDGFVVRLDGEIILAFDCPDTADCIDPDRLVPDGALLEMARTFLHAGVRLRFVPI